MTTVEAHGALALSVNERLFGLWDLIDRRNRQLGWRRFDWSDLESLPWLLSAGSGPKGRVLRVGVRGLDMVAPVQFHRLLRMKPQVIPTAFYHVGTAYLVRNRTADGGAIPAADIAAICRTALSHRLDAPFVCWSHPYAHHAGTWKREASDDRPPSCAHHTARVGELLVRAGLDLGIDELVLAGVSAANALMTYHNWSYTGESGCTVSYYPFTDDETINTAADVAVLFGVAPPEHRSDLMQARLEGIVRMALSEQLPDGSWRYCTRRHYARTGDTPFIDNHHSAQVVQALSKLCIEGGLPAGLRRDALAGIRSGITYYLEKFYDSEGRGSYFPDSPARETPIVGYSEGIAAIYWALRCGAITTAEERLRTRDMASKMLDRALELINPKTGDVACTRIYGRKYHLRSLRWGSGPLLEAISYALHLRQELSRGN
jgi:hypothetical protein